MLLRTSQVVGLAVLITVIGGHAQAPADGGWTQFRGPNATGIAAGTAIPPIEFGPSKNLLWWTPLTSGHSSPVVWGDRIFLTGFDRERKMLEVIALNRRGNGKARLVGDRVVYWHEHSRCVRRRCLRVDLVRVRRNQSMAGVA